MAAQVEELEFQAETRQLLDLMIHSIYSNPDTFLREVISNSSDALDKLRLAALQDSSLGVDTSDLHIELVPDAAARTLTIRDNGIGMSRDEVVDLIGTLAKSGTGQMREALAAVGLGQVMVETDAPFLTPHPRRGKRNGPYLIAHTIRFLSEQLDWDEASCCEQLRRNTLAAYGGPWEDVHGVTPLQLPASGEETR